MKNTITVLSVSLGLLAIGVPASAQEESNVHFFTANVGGGFSTPVYSTGRRNDDGWNIGAGAGINPFSHLGLLGEFHFDSFGINGSTLNDLGFPGGDMRIWSFTANPVIHLTPHGPADVYLIGGGGVYHRLVEFTAPTTATFTAFDPFFGVFYPVAVPATQVLESYSVTKGGVNGGAGVSFRLGSGHAKVYMEARYHHMYTTPKATTFLPVTFGIRW